MADDIGGDPACWADEFPEYLGLDRGDDLGQGPRRADHEETHFPGAVFVDLDALAMVVAGLPLPGLYVGSFSQWSPDDARPIAAG